MGYEGFDCSRFGLADAQRILHHLQKFEYN